MATGTSFKQQCPSCEAMVPIRDPGLIGRKIDCPKCKYRFVVEEPEGEEEDAKPDKKKAGDSKGKNGKADKAAASKGGPRRRDDEDDAGRPAKKKKSGGGGSMLILGGGLAVVAVVAIVVGVVVLSGGDSGTSPPSGGGGPVGGTPVANNPAEGQPGSNPTTPKEPVSVHENITNLLPNDTEVVISYPMPYTLGSSIRTAAIDEAEAGFRPARFQTNMGFGVDEINRVVTALNVKDGWVFTRLQAKKPYKPEVIKAQLRLEQQPGVKGKSGKDYQVFHTKSELDSLSNLLLKFNQPRETLAVHFYDNNTIIFADPAPLRKFLEADAKPEYLTKLNVSGSASGGTTPAPATPGTMMGTPPGMSPMPGGGPPMPSGEMTGMTPGGMMGMAPGGMMGMTPGMSTGTPTQAEPVPASYMTVDKSLKAILDRIEKVEENRTTRKKEPVAIVTIAGLMEPLQAPVMAEFNKQLAEQNVPMLERFLTQQFISSEVRKFTAGGISLWSFDQGKAGMALAVEIKTRSDAATYEKRIRPLLPLALPVFKLGLGLDVKVGSNKQQPGMTPGMYPGMYPGIPGGPTPMPPGGYSAETPMPGMESGGMEEPIPGSSTPRKSDGTIAFYQEDRLLVGTLELQLTSDAYDLIFPFVREGMVYLKSQSELASTRPRYYELGKALQAYVNEKDQFPPGAMPRPLSSDNGPPWRPEQRLSWVVALLPYLGDEYRDWKIDLDKGWNEQMDMEEVTRQRLSVPNVFRAHRNLLVSTRVVAPLLAHRLPKLSPPHVKYPNRDVPVAVTHFVAIAGLGLDAAEYRADDTLTAKKLGLFGYDRVTKKADVKDGLDKTIAFILVPDEHKSPWMAGGGATLRAVADEREDPAPLAPFVCIDYPGKGEDTKWKGKRGTLAIMADGKVRFIPADLPPATFRALCTIAGGEPLPKLDTICPVIEEEQGPELRTDVPPIRATPTPVTTPPVTTPPGTTPPVKPEKPAAGGSTAMTAVDLTKDFADKEADSPALKEAVKKYEGRVFEVTGEVLSAMSFPNGSCTVQLKGAPRPNTTSLYMLLNCTFQPGSSSMTKAKSLKSGQTVKIRGGFLVGTNVFVTLKDCELLEGK